MLKAFAVTGLWHDKRLQERVKYLRACVCQCVFRVLSSGRVRDVDITQSHGQAWVSANCIKWSFQRLHPPPCASFMAQPIPASNQSEFSHQGLPWHATSCLGFPCGSLLEPKQKLHPLRKVSADVRYLVRFPRTTRHLLLVNHGHVSMEQTVGRGGQTQAWLSQTRTYSHIPVCDFKQDLKYSWHQCWG